MDAQETAKFKVDSKFLTRLYLVAATHKIDQKNIEVDLTTRKINFRMDIPQHKILAFLEDLEKATDGFD